MVKRATQLIGKPVVAADTGARLGTVADLLLDDGSGSLIGLVLRHGMMRSEDVMPASAIQTLGADAIVSRSSELIDAKEWRRRRESESPLERGDDVGTAERRDPRAVEPR